MVRLVSVDVETAISYDHVVEIGMVEIVDGARTGREYKSRFKPKVPVNWRSESVHGLSTAMLANEPAFEDRIGEIVAFAGDARLIAHNRAYEYNTLRKEFARVGLPEWEVDRFICTMKMARQAGLPGKLRDACKALGIPTDHLGKRHDALEDARLGADLYIALVSYEPSAEIPAYDAPGRVSPHRGAVTLDPVQVAVLHRARVSGIRVSGLAGTGKSTLAAAIAGDAALRGRRCLLFGDSPRLASPPPMPVGDARLHPTLQSRYMAMPRPAPVGAMPVVDHDPVALRAALDPDGAALALRLLGKARELVALHDMGASEIERSIMPFAIAEEAVARLSLALGDARLLADEVLGGNERPGATLGTIVAALDDPAPSDGIPAFVLDESPGPLEAYLTELAAREEGADRSRQELLRLSAALGEYIDFGGTVSQACSQARARLRAVVEALDLLEGHPTVSAASVAAPAGSGEARAIAWCVEKGYERRNAIQACQRLSVRDEDVVEALAPFLAMHGGRACTDVRAVAEADRVPSGPTVDIGAVAQRLREARCAAARLRGSLPGLRDGLPASLLAALMHTPLNEAVVPEPQAEAPERLVAAEMLRALREEFAALGYGDVLAPADRFEERVARARAFAARTVPTARPAPAEVLDLLLPFHATLPATGGEVPVEAWGPRVTRLRPSDPAAGEEGLLALAGAGGFDVVVVDDADGVSAEILAGLHLCAPVVHLLGAAADGGVTHLDRPYRQVTSGLLATGPCGSAPRLGGPDKGGVILRGYDGGGKFDARYAANFLAARGREAGLGVTVVAEADAGGDLGEHDVVVVYGDHAHEAAAKATRHARLAVVACGKSMPTLVAAVPAPGPETEGLHGQGWVLVSSAPDGRVYGKDGRLAVVAVEPQWLDLQADDVPSRLGRLRAAGWNPVMAWSGSPRAPVVLAGLLEASSVPAGADIDRVFDVALPERPVLKPFAATAVPSAPAGLGLQDALRWRLRYLRDELLAKATPHVEPGRCILRDEMIEAIIAHGVRDKAGFQRIPRGLREGTDGIQVPLLETIGAVMDGPSPKPPSPKPSGLPVVPSPKPQLDLPDMVPPHMIPARPPAPRAGA